MGYFLTVLYEFLIALTVGASLHIALSLGGKMFLAFPVIYTVSRYTLVLCQEAGIAPWIAFGLGLCSALIMGVSFAFLEKRLSKDSFSVLGLASVFASIALVKSWDSLTNGVLGIAGIDRPAGFETLSGMVWIAGAIAVFTLTLEWTLLKTKLSRQWRALKEAPHILEGIGLSSKKLSFWTIIFSSIFLALAGMPQVWFVQYIDPSVGGILALLQGLSIAILITKPKVSHVIFATLFVVLAPEIFRFIDLPSSLMGSMRSILYSILLLVILHVLQKRILNTNRQI